MKHTIGIIGAGRLGTALARAFSKTDNEVAIINSRDPESLKLQLNILLPGVEAKEIRELIAWADIIILAVPLRQFHTLPLSEMSDKIVIDAMNYWSPIDGKLSEFDDYAMSSSVVIAQSLPSSHVIKTLNSVAYGEIDEQTLQADEGNRRALALAGDDEVSKKVVSDLARQIGFDPVDVGELKNGVLFQPDTKLFNVRLSRKQLQTEILPRL